MQRCAWCLCNEKMTAYHDEEWGIPLHDDRKQFEFLMMEVMQCGLNWNMMIQKREIFRHCFDQFDYDKVAEYKEHDIERILSVEGMIKSPRKISAVIHNARCFQALQKEYGSFSQYLWSYTDGKTLLYPGHQNGKIPPRNVLSDKISKDLKAHGFKYLGSVTVYSHLQASGIINEHVETCFRYQDILAHYPTVNVGILPEDLKEFCLNKKNAYEDYPFGDYPICCKLNGKIFAQIYPHPEDYKITVKCTAEAGQFYRHAFPGVVVRGYHCPPVQQPYWNTVYLDNISPEEVFNMIDQAYDCVLQSFSQKVQKQILQESNESNPV